MKRQPTLKYEVLLLLLTLIFVALGCCSTYVVLSARGLYPHSTSPVEVPRTNSQITQLSYYTTISDSIDGMVEIAGAAYMETNLPNPDKRIDLLLISAEDTFLITTQLAPRHDLSAERTGKNVQGINHSYSGKFSHLVLPDGYYQLGLMCYENEQTSGYVALPHSFYKEGRSFRTSTISSLEQVSTRVETLNGVDLTAVDEISTDPLPWHYVTLEAQDGIYLCFNGWIANILFDSKNANSFLAFTDENGATKTFSTISYYGKSVEQAVGSSLANYGFFDAYIPLSELQSGLYRMDVLVQYPEGTTKPEISYQLSIADSGLEKTAVLTVAKKPTADEVKVVNGVDMTKLDLIADKPQPWHSLQMVGQDSDGIQFDGWIAMMDLESEKSCAFLSVTDEAGITRVFETIPYESDSLEETLGTNRANHGFFTINLPKSSLPSGKYSVILLVQYPEGTWKPGMTHMINVGPDGTAEFISGF